MNIHKAKKELEIHAKEDLEVKMLGGALYARGFCCSNRAECNRCHISKVWLEDVSAWERCRSCCNDGYV